MSMRGLKIYHVNTRSILNKISLLQALYSNVDILCCSETWLDNRVSDRLIEISGKIVFRCDRHVKVRDYSKKVFGGGVCIYVGYQFSSYSEKIDKYSKVTSDYEVLTVTISKPNHRKLLIICVYKPPTGKIENCIMFLKEIISDSKLSKREVWILGDFNVDILKRNDPKVISIHEFCKKSGLNQLVKDITRPNKGGGSCIDLIMSNCPFISVIGVANDYISDHYTIFCVRKKSRENKECILKTVRNYRRYDEDIFENLLKSKNWALYGTLIDLNLQWSFIYENVKEILSIMCPYKVISSRKVPTPWITPDIFNMINEKREIVKRYKATHAQDILLELRTHRNKLNTKIEKAKSLHITQSLHRKCKNPKKFWRIIKAMIDPLDTWDIESVTFIDPITGNPVLDEDKPEFLNNYFAGIAEKTCDFTKIVHPVLENNIEIGFDFQPPDIDDLIHLIREIDITTSSCVQGINMKMCKRVISIIPEKFLLLFANSMYNGVFPSDWAISTVTLLPKTGDKTNPGNWRPVSNTNIFAKILEKLVHRQVTDFLFTNNIISEYQYGFVPGRSTHKAIFKFVKNIYSSINNNKIIGVVFLDIAKAFNCLNHDIFDIILANHGFDNRVRQWFKSYNNRYQCVKIGDKKSIVQRVPHGAAQGTVLGPTMFILYFDAISQQILRCKISKFADDCLIY